MSFFEKQESYKNWIKGLSAIIAVLVIIIILTIKSLIEVSSNKTVKIQVPQFLESGEYTIGATHASENTFKMWAEVWANMIGNFSYKNIDDKFENILRFVDDQTAYKNKAEIVKFIDFAKKNFLSQEFKIQDVIVEQASDGYSKVTVTGTMNRYIGQTVDSLSGLRYSYTFLCYVRNGSIYIKSIHSSFYALHDTQTQKQLKYNNFVHFDEVLQ